jgi:hypothetical protein
VAGPGVITGPATITIPNSTITIPNSWSTNVVGVPVWDSNISFSKNNSMSFSTPCLEELGIKSIPMECFMCSHFKKIDMSDVLIVHKAKEELKK